jgi:hypothetical protein
MKKFSSRKIVALNTAFVLVAAAILIFLLRAPEESTARLPQDEIHAKFHLIESKKEAEKSCTDCHSESGESPLSENHPPKYRCLFCHKRN